MEPLVSTDRLARELGAPGLLVLDASYHVKLPGEPERDARAEHAAGHVPGALFMDLAGFSDPASPLPSTMPDRPRFAARMAALGAGAASRIVLYDDAAHHTAARAWVMLRAFGVDAVAILDGGLAKWKAEGRALETGERAPAADTVAFIAPAAGRGLIDLARMRAIAVEGPDAGGTQIVDARSAARFTGAQADPRAGVAPGHIPGSRNLPYHHLFRDDGTWKRGAELAAAFAAAGVDPARPMAMTCGSGITASALAFAAHLLGQEAAVYDGSWSEWGAHPDTPKATGAAA